MKKISNYIGGKHCEPHNQEYIDNIDPATGEVYSLIPNSSSEDIIYTNLFTGVHGNYLKPSIVAQGLDPENLETSDASNMNFSSGASKPKSWKDIWGSGQGISSIKNVAPAKVLIDRLKSEYKDAKSKLSK